MYERELLKKDTVLYLGKNSYIIDETIGYGGSTIVYKSHYNDNLNVQTVHYVLIKELFPYTINGEIYRNKDGFICCDKNAIETFENSKNTFKIGNKANIDLLSKMPENISGNINSYEEYGSYYSVLSLHGGEILSTIIEKNNDFSLLEICNIIKSILYALKSFHNENYLNLDVSPDNILMVNRQAMFIDYNSCWNITKTQPKDFVFSLKEGFSAPEIKMQQFDKIDYATDLFSVGAILFRMVTGKNVQSSDLNWNVLKRHFPRSLPKFQNIPITAIQKLVDIIKKSLHILSVKRYQNIDEFVRDIEELEKRIEYIGISKCAIWEYCNRTKKNMNNEKYNYIEQSIKIKTLQKYDINSIIQEMYDGNNFLLVGAGGIGKSRLLNELLKHNGNSFNDSRAVFCYIPLYNYQLQNENSYFIREQLLKGLNSEKGELVESAKYQLEKLFQSDKVQIVFLLDGLNEAGKHRFNLLKEIEYLSSKTGVSVILTDRTDEAKEYAIKNFTVAELLPLSIDVVEKELILMGKALPLNKQMQTLLQSPLLLTLYAQTIEISQKEFTINSPEDMIRIYLENIVNQEMRISTGDEKAQLEKRFIIEHIYPNLAHKMYVQHRSTLTLQEMYKIVEKTKKQLYKKQFGIAFPQYLGKTRNIFNQLTSTNELFDYVINEQLIKRLNLIVQNNENFILFHSDFENYLVQQAKSNRNKIISKSWKEWTFKSIVIVIIISVATYSGDYYLKKILTQEKEIVLSQQEYEIIEPKLSELSVNLSITGRIFQYLDDVLNSAKKNINATLSNEDLAYEIQQKSNGLKSDYSLYMPYENNLYELDNFRLNISIENLISLYTQSQQMQSDSEKMLMYIQNRFTDTQSSMYIFSKELKKESIVVFSEYITAYKNVCFLELDILLNSLDNKSYDKLTEMLTYSPIFSEHISNGVDKDAINRIDIAKSTLKKKENYLKIKLMDGN